MKRRQFFVMVPSVFSAIVAVSTAKSAPSRKNSNKVHSNQECPPNCVYCIYANWGSSKGWSDRKRRLEESRTGLVR